MRIRRSFMGAASCGAFVYDNKSRASRLLDRPRGIFGALAAIKETYFTASYIIKNFLTVFEICLSFWFTCVILLSIAWASGYDGFYSIIPNQMVSCYSIAKFHWIFKVHTHLCMCEIWVIYFICCFLLFLPAPIRHHLPSIFLDDDRQAYASCIFDMAKIRHPGFDYRL